MNSLVPATEHQFTPQMKWETLGYIQSGNVVRAGRWPPRVSRVDAIPSSAPCEAVTEQAAFCLSASVSSSVQWS